MPSNRHRFPAEIAARLRASHGQCTRHAARFRSRLSPARRSGSEIPDPRRERSWWIAYLVLLLGIPLAAADKMDVINLKNGDRITCEIKGLDQSVLTVSTDPLGNVSVHWGEVANLTSPRQFDVQLSSGEHYLGSMLVSPAGQMVLGLVDGTTTTVALDDVIRLAAIGASAWSRMDGSLDAGFSFTQADLETHYTINGAATYRSPRYQFGSTFASQLTTREDDDPLSR